MDPKETRTLSLVEDGAAPSAEAAEAADAEQAGAGSFETSVAELHQAFEDLMKVTTAKITLARNGSPENEADQEAMEKLNDQQEMAIALFSARAKLASAAARTMEEIDEWYRVREGLMQGTINRFPNSSAAAKH